MIIGIDPGRNGGIAKIHAEGMILALPMPGTYRDIALYLRQHSGDRRIFVYLEKVTRPAKLMEHYGAIKGILATLDIPYDEVRPQEWMKKLGCMTKGNKNVTKQKAQSLWPHLKITHAIADALLIAEYGRRARLRA